MIKKQLYWKNKNSSLTVSKKKYNVANMRRVFAQEYHVPFSLKKSTMEAENRAIYGDTGFRRHLYEEWL